MVVDVESRAKFTARNLFVLLYLAHTCRLLSRQHILSRSSLKLAAVAETTFRDARQQVQ